MGILDSLREKVLVQDVQVFRFEMDGESGGEGEERQGERGGSHHSEAPLANEQRGREPQVTGQSGKKGRDETCWKHQVNGTI